MADFDDFQVMSFDCYGTMIDWETGILSQLRPWTQALGISFADAEILEAFGVAESIQETETPDALYPKVLELVHHRLAGRWGIAPNESAAIKFGESVGTWPAFVDSKEALTQLKQRYRLVILSNVDRTSFAVSNRRLGIEFDAVYTAEDIGSYKPDARNFSYLIQSEEAAGYPSSVILHVGQSLFHDHVPACRPGDLLGTTS